jgi:hypothetical protein
MPAEGRPGTLTARISAAPSLRAISCTTYSGSPFSHDELIQIEATARGRSVEEGGYLWRGELRLWDNEILMGWYAANDGSVRSKGTMYFVMHPHGIHATGRWVGLSYDGNIVTGWSSMARTEAEARELVGELKEQDAAPSR